MLDASLKSSNLLIQLSRLRLLLASLVHWSIYRISSQRTVHVRPEISSGMSPINVCVYAPSVLHRGDPTRPPQRRGYEWAIDQNGHVQGPQEGYAEDCLAYPYEGGRIAFD